MAGSRFLVVAEKPDMARKIVAGIKLLETVEQKSDSKVVFWESDHYWICAARGHLFQMQDIDDYVGRKTYWNELNLLPFVPNPFKVKPLEIKTKDGKERDGDAFARYTLIKKLHDRNDCSGVFVATDPDVEGELIYDFIKSYGNLNKPTYRVLCEDLVDKNIKKYIDNRVPIKNREQEIKQGWARAIADWLIGINITRFESVRAETMLNVGRVNTCIVNMIYDRCMEIKRFIPKDYFILESKNNFSDGVLTLKSEYEFDFEELETAKEVCEEYNNQECIVKDVTCKDTVVSPPLLFSQSKLQNELSNKFDYKPDETLTLTQALYDEGYVTYPRTSSQYRTVDEARDDERIIGRIESMGHKVRFQNTKRVYDNNKVESHSALFLTLKIAFTKDDLEKGMGHSKNINIDKLWNCYKTIFDRCCAAFCSEPKIDAVTEYLIAIGDDEEPIEEIKVTGRVNKSLGWEQFIKPEKEKKDEEGKSKLPSLEKGQHFKPNFKVIKKTTNPPKYYTVETLNNKLLNPFGKTRKKGNEDEEIEAIKANVSIGTEASKPQILKTALDNELIELKKKEYHITNKGIYLCETLKKDGIIINVDSTVELQKQIKDVAIGKISIPQLTEIITQKIENWFVNSTEKVEKFTNVEEPVCNCPICGGNVIEKTVNLKNGGKTKNWSCNNKTCNFIIWEENKYLESFGKKFNAILVKNLCSNKKVVRLNGCVSKKDPNKKFDCMLHMDWVDGKLKLNVTFDAPKKAEPKNAAWGKQGGGRLD